MTTTTSFSSRESPRTISSAPRERATNKKTHAHIDLSGQKYVPSGVHLDPLPEYNRLFRDTLIEPCSGNATSFDRCFPAQPYTSIHRIYERRSTRCNEDHKDISSSDRRKRRVSDEYRPTNIKMTPTRTV